MKTVKSTLLGTCTITERSEKEIVKQLKRIIGDHRGLVIASILKDTPSYLEYKFNVKVTPQLVSTAREKLLELKHDGISLNFYEPILDMVATRSIVHMNNDCFYREIDETLRPHIIKPEMKIV